jgi:glycosyltransferase involved in cell wall biosynthesis
VRVLALETEPSATRGGQEHSLLDVCAGLAAGGHEVTLAHVDDGDLLPRYRAAGVRTLGVRGYSVDRARLIGSAAHVAVSLIRALRARPNVVYINQYHDALFAAAVARLLHVPLVCHLRLFPPSAFCGQWRVGLTGVSRFIAVSEATRRAYVDRGFDPEAIDVVVNGIDVERFRPLGDRDALRRAVGLSPDDFAILYIGRINRPKNLEGLIRAFAAARRSLPGAKLLVAGRPLEVGTVAEGERYLESLRSLAASLHVANDVQWLGPRRDAVQLYNAADVCTLVSREPETFGRVLAESMACATPSIGTTVGGVPEVLIGDAARFLVPPDDDAALAECLLGLANWRERDPSLGMRLRTITVEHFDSRRMVREVARVLERTVAEGAVRRGPRGLRSSVFATPARTASAR